MQMWCDDMDDEDIDNANCDGYCNGCDNCEDVNMQEDL